MSSTTEEGAAKGNGGGGSDDPAAEAAITMEQVDVYFKTLSLSRVASIVNSILSTARNNMLRLSRASSRLELD